MPKLIHITDLYHPHEDPDDHFDLAQIFALAKNGDIDLCHIIIDWPTKEKQGDPALCAVAQLNHLAGLDVPVTIGADVDKFRGKPELWANASYSDVKAADRIIEILPGGIIDRQMTYDEYIDDEAIDAIREKLSV